MRQLFARLVDETKDQPEVEVKRKKDNYIPPEHNDPNPYITIARQRIMLEEFRKRIYILIQSEQTYKYLLKKKKPKQPQKAKLGRPYSRKTRTLYKYHPVKNSLVKSDFFMVALFTNIYEVPKVDHEFLRWLILYQYESFDKQVFRAWDITSSDGWFYEKIKNCEIEKQKTVGAQSFYFLPLKKRAEIEKEYNEYLKLWKDQTLSKRQKQLRSIYRTLKNK